MVRPNRSRRDMRALLIQECDHFAERFADKGLSLPELRGALVDGRPVQVDAHFIFAALYHADHPDWREFTYQRVQDRPFVLTVDDALEPA